MGSVIFLDGGTDAYFRADDWPRPMSVDEIPLYRQKLADFNAPSEG